MIPAAQLTVEDLKQRLKEVEEFLKEPNFKEQFERYILLRRWLITFAKDTSQHEDHRVDAYVGSNALKFAMNATSGAIRRLAKRFEYKESALYGTPVPPVKHYFAHNCLTTACRVN